MSTTARQVIAFDFGSKRMGVAYGQSLTGTSKALAPIKAQDGIPHWDSLSEHIDTWQPDTLVVGIPFNMDGSISEMAHRARKFANRLHERYQLPVFIIDERLTTAEAKDIHFEHGGGTNFKKESVDGIAAQLILESWFASERLIPSHTPLKDM